MAGRTLQQLPTVSASATGQWPTLLMTPADASAASNAPIYFWAPRTLLVWRDLELSRRLPMASLKGALLAVGLVGVVFGIIPAHMWWMSSARWLGGLMIVSGISLLIGADAGVVTLTAIACVQATTGIGAHATPEVELAALVIAGRLVWEYLQASRTART